MKLNTLIKRRNLLKAQLQNIQQKLSDLDTEIEALVGEGNKEFVKAGDDFCSVSVIEAVRVGWDNTRLTKFLGAKASRFQKETPYVQLRIQRLTETAFRKATRSK